MRVAKQSKKIMHVRNNIEKALKHSAAPLAKTFQRVKNVVSDPRFAVFQPVALPFTQFFPVANGH